MQVNSELLPSKISSADISVVNNPIVQASGLPNAAYTDEVVFNYERDHIFSKTWVAVAYADEFTDGLVRPQSFMGTPILITKPVGGDIRVFHNVCSHRGVQLVDKEVNSNGMIVCPYHSWTYSTEGELKATPNIGGVGVSTLPDVCNEQRGLKAIRSHIWMGVLFINMLGDAPAFEEDAQDIIARTNDLMGESAQGLIQSNADDVDMEIVLNANWKFAIENYLEAYHLPFVHPGLNSYSPLSEHTPLVHGKKLSGQITSTFDPKLSSGKSLPVFPDWDELEMSTGDYPAVYPNLLLGFQANHVFAMIIHPLTASTTREEVKIFYVGEAAKDENLARLRNETRANWMEVFAEDIGPCERMQLGRSSPGYQGGTFSPVLDVCSHHFHKWVANQYTEAA